MWLFKLFMLVVAKSQLQHLAGGGKKKKSRQEMREHGDRAGGIFNKLPCEAIMKLLYTRSLEGDEGFTSQQKGNCCLKNKN